MKKFVCTMAGLMLSLGMVSQVEAQQQIYGSDTLYEMTNYLAGTGSCGSIQYMGGGSGTGAAAMVAGTQEIAPMSRLLKSSEVDGGVPECWAHSLDAISIYRSGNSLATADGYCTGGTEYDCESTADETSGNIILDISDLNADGNVDCYGCVDDDNDGVTDEYVFSSWKDVLALAYGGKHHDASATVDCDSDVRRTLAGLSAATAFGGLEQAMDCEKDCWENFFMKDPSVPCTDEKCNINWHLWRRGDASGTTDTFKSMVGINSFCNGNETEDNDPIRRLVSDDEDIPGRTDMPIVVTTSADNDCTGDGGANLQVVANAATLGWLLPIVVPPTYVKNTNSCNTGDFGWKSVPVALAPFCEDGANSLFGMCLEPMDANGDYGCIDNANNPNMYTPAGADTRARNMVQRDKDGNIVLDENGDEVWAAYYNINALNVIPTYSVPPCNYDNSTEQIACLTVASPCTVGYAGMGGNENIPQSVGIEVAGVRATVANIQSFTYPMTRYLYVNTLVGRANVTDTDEKDLMECFLDPSLGHLAPAQAHAGFVAMDTDPQLVDCP